MTGFWRWLFTPRIEPGPELWVEIDGKPFRFTDREADTLLDLSVIHEDDHGALWFETQGNRFRVRVRPSSARRRKELLTHRSVDPE